MKETHKRVSVYLDAETVKKIEAESEKTGIPVSTIVRSVVKKHYAK